MDDFNPNKDLLNGLKGLHSSDKVARLIFEDFASRQRSQKETKVEAILQRLDRQGDTIPRPPVIRVFKSLQNLGCGRFILGRGSKPSRFRWDYDLVSVGKAATGSPGSEHGIRRVDEGGEEDEEPNEEINGPKRRGIPHQYQLRPDCRIEFVLPVDLTAREAERLGEFIKTLPFGVQD